MHKLGLAMAVVTGSVLATAACGGVSDGGTMFADNAGTASGGSGDRGASGATSTKGGGSAAGGSETTVGGAPDSPGSGSAGDGTAVGVGGEPASLPPPDPAVKDGCTAWCASVVAANCSKKTTEPDCVFGCRAIAGSATCNERYKQLFACAQGATFACSKEGDAVPQGCEAKYAQAALCVLGHPDESLQAPCKGYCDRAEAAACPNSVPSSECVYGCEVQSSVVPTCTTDWKTFVSCAQTAEVQCNAKGDPSPDACAASYLKYVACVAEVAQ